MKRTLILAWAVLAALVLPAWAADDKVADEDKKFEGTWVVVAMEVGGRKMQEEAFAEMTFTFKGKNYEQKIGDMLVEAGKQDLDPSKKPMNMDITVTDGETKGKKQLAIYEWDGADKVKICAADHDDTNRPAKFETKEGSKEMIFILKKKK
ncbi:MAG: TIGR03067 domain-containing protein [Gemmatales bacterium]